MRIAMVLTPLSDEYLRLAVQIGVTDIVARYPGLDFMALLQLKQRIEDAGLRLSVIEGYVPMDQIVLGQEGAAKQTQDFITLIRNMGGVGIPTLCYNFMASGDMSRTSFTTRTRGGALVSSFDIDLLRQAPHAVGAPTAAQLWDRLERFLNAVIPAAQEANVNLAMHPDDPPVADLLGHSRIMSSPENYEKLIHLVPSPRNGICFCQGCFSEMGVDVPATIRRLGRHVHYVHFRDVCGCSGKFHEAFHDAGQTNMVEAMRAWHEVGFKGVMRPDHVPRLEGEEGDASGYTMLGRLHAVGYMRGLIQSVTHLCPAPQPVGEAIGAQA